MQTFDWISMCLRNNLFLNLRSVAKIKTNEDLFGEELSNPTYRCISLVFRTHSKTRLDSNR